MNQTGQHHPRGDEDVAKRWPFDATATDDDMPAGFEHRIVDAATAPSLEGIKPAGAFWPSVPECYQEKAAAPAVQPEVASAVVDAVEEMQLDANFFVCGSVRFALGESEVFLSQREALVLGSRLVAHAVACGESA